LLSPRASSPLGRFPASITSRLSLFTFSVRVGSEVLSVVTTTSAAPPEPDDAAPDAHLPRINRDAVYLSACLIAGIRLAREPQVNVRGEPARPSRSRSIWHTIYNRVFRKVPERIER